jgi:hypothetical protein
MVTNALLRAHCGGKKRSWRVAAAISAAGLLAACGGGGGGGEAGPTPPITRTEAQAGDYFLYGWTMATAVPAGVRGQTWESVQTYHSIAADGTNRTVTTNSTGMPGGQTTFDVNDGLVGYSDVIGGDVNCPYTPAAQWSPPYPRSVGQTWTSTSTSTCGTPTTTTTISGEVVAREQLSVPAGSFDSYRVDNTGVTMTPLSTTGGGNSVLEKDTCWYSVQRGVLLRCDSTITTTPANSTTPSNVDSITLVITGLGGPARAAQGNVLARFTGTWSVQYVGGNSGNCAQLAVTARGAISGNCTAASGASFAVAGSVNEGGAVDITLPTGGKLTGTLTTPYTGNGTWADSGLTGTWTASHY